MTCLLILLKTDSFLFSMQVHVTLTTDSGKLLSKVNMVQPQGEMMFLNALRVAHLALKHRQSKNHKTRIIAFVGSPIKEQQKEVIFFMYCRRNCSFLSTCDMNFCAGA